MSTDARSADVQAVIDAWNNLGSHPAYHLMWQNKLRAEWPVLANALDNLVRGGSHE